MADSPSPGILQWDEKDDSTPDRNKKLALGMLLIAMSMCSVAFFGSFSMALALLFLGVYGGYLTWDYLAYPPPIPYEMRISEPEPVFPQDTRLDALVSATQLNGEALRFIVEYINANSGTPAPKA